MGSSTSSYATAGIALKVSGALKPHHHDKVETPSVGLTWKYTNDIWTNVFYEYSSISERYLKNILEYEKKLIHFTESEFLVQNIEAEKFQ
jgi:hypothetical protein